MILITGGAYHGKRNYAKQMYPGIDFVDGISCAEETIFACQGMDHFHSYIENRMREGKKLPELLKMVEKLKRENPEIVLITDEIGYGIVPVDAFYREYREIHGRVCTQIAAEAKEVHRVICGIGTVIKG